MESLHSTAEIKHNIVNQLYFNRLKKKQIKEENLKLYNWENSDYNPTDGFRYFKIHPGHGHS